MGNRVDFKLERGPNITVRSRMIFVVLGGLLFGFGSAAGKRMYQRISPQRHGIPVVRRYHYHAGNIRRGLHHGVLFQKTLAVKETKHGTTRTIYDKS